MTSSDNTPQADRPLSPHLSAYRWQLTSLLSIAHRLSGVALIIGLVALSFWLFFLGQNAQASALVKIIFFSWFGKLVQIGFTAAFFYHLLNGVRHLLWDFNLGLELPQVYRSGYIVIVLTLLLTLAVWVGT